MGITVNSLLIGIFSGVFGFVSGYWLRVFTNRRNLIDKARADLIAAMDNEIFSLASRNRLKDVSAFEAIGNLLKAASGYDAVCFSGDRKRFKDQWKDYKNQIDHANLKDTAKDGFESFGYRNHLTAAARLKDVRETILN
jgi:hypothetical protein